MGPVMDSGLISTLSCSPSRAKEHREEKQAALIGVSLPEALTTLTIAACAVCTYKLYTEAHTGFAYFASMACPSPTLLH